MNNCNVDLSEMSVSGDCYVNARDKALKKEIVRERKKARRVQWKKEVAEAQSLEDVVRIYEKYDLRDLEAFLIGLKHGTILELVCGKIPGSNPTPPPVYKRHAHQKRLANDTIKEASKELEEISRKKIQNLCIPL